jgi:CO/xanthine dehydrogenase Mo-binding subunit
MDGGPYTSTSPAVILVATTFAAGPYEVPNALLEGTVVYTNNPPSGAMRGFGAVQACFAYERQMDRLAQALNVDPIELRLRNALHPGSVLPTGQVLTGPAPVAELIRRCASVPLPEATPARDAIDLPGGAGNVSHGERLARGVGFALGFKNVSYSAGSDDYSQVMVRVLVGADGPVAEVASAAAEVGQGIHTILVQVARAELGIDRVVLLPASTASGSSGPSSASRQTMMSGGAVQLACAAVRDEILARVRRAFRRAGQSAPAALGLEDGRVMADGLVVGTIDEYLDPPIEVTGTYHHRRTEPLDERGQGDVHVAFSFAAQRAVVEVDLDLGLTRVIQVAAAQDVGRALNPQGVEGQIEGGTAQGIGFVLLEELDVHEGRIRNPSFTDYLIPTMLDMPAVVPELVEEPDPSLPFGAKGIAEHPLIVATAAVAAAVRDATGREVNRIPVRPDDLIGLAPPASSLGPPRAPDVPGNAPIPEYHGLVSSREVPIQPSRSNETLPQDS